MLQCGSWQPRVCICTALAEVKYLIEHPFLLHWSQLLLKFNLSWSCLPHTRPIPTPCEGWNLKAVRICSLFTLFFFVCFERWEHRFLMNGKHLNEGPSTHSYSKLESEGEAGIFLSEYINAVHLKICLLYTVFIYFLFYFFSLSVEKKV